MNRLYMGSWKKKQYPFEVTFSGIRKSWLEMKGRKDNFKTTTSDAVQFLVEGWNGKWDPVKPLKEELKDTIRGANGLKGGKKVKSRA